VAQKNGKVLLCCFAGCSVDKIVAKLGLTMGDLFADAEAEADGLTLEDYANAKRLPLAFLRELGLTEFRYRGRSAVRIPYYDERDREVAVRQRLSLAGRQRFNWRRGSKTFPYGLWRLADARAADYVILAEGESDAQTFWYYGFPALGIPGAAAWREDWAGALAGIARIYVIRESDKGGETLVGALSRSSLRERIQVVSLEAFGAKDANDLHLVSPERFAERFQKALERAVPLRQALAPRGGPAPTLEEVERAFLKFLRLADSHVVRVVLAVAAAHLLDGDPLWLVLVAPSSSAKTEFIAPLTKVPDAHLLSSLTPQTLASGWQQGRASLLLKMGPAPLLCLKDFGSILSLRQDDRSAILGALREIYDGRYDKAFGNGAEVHWAGKLTLIAASTEALDEYQSVLSILGERFVLCRVIQPDPEAASLRAQIVASRARGGAQERERVSAMVGSFLAALPLTQPKGAPSRWLATLAAFVAAARTGTVRDRRHGDLVMVPRHEGPGRLSKQLIQLDRGLRWIDPDISPEKAREIVMRVALDSIPRQRMQALGAVAASPGRTLTTKEVAAVLRLPTTSARRVLEDLQAVECLVPSGRGLGIEVSWALSDVVKRRVSGAKIDLAEAGRR
jgi:hypothetical protein